MIRENLGSAFFVIYVQYWQSDSDGQIYFPMVQMDPSDKQVLRRRNIFPMENKWRHDSWEADVSKLRLSDGSDGSVGQARLLSDK